MTVTVGRAFALNFLAESKKYPNIKATKLSGVTSFFIENDIFIASHICG